MNRKGRMMIYCQSCDKYMVMDDADFNWTCPVCGNLMVTMRCSRCGTKWRVRNMDKLPSICANPKCHTPYWNRERVRDRKTGKYIPADKRRTTDE